MAFDGLAVAQDPARETEALYKRPFTELVSDERVPRQVKDLMLIAAQRAGLSTWRAVNDFMRLSPEEYQRKLIKDRRDLSDYIHRLLMAALKKDLHTYIERLREGIDRDMDRLNDALNELSSDGNQTGLRAELVEARRRYRAYREELEQIDAQVRDAPASEDGIASISRLYNSVDVAARGFYRTAVFWRNAVRSTYQGASAACRSASRMLQNVNISQITGYIRRLVP